MPRPRKTDRDEMATVKIENAFWSLLETERYSDITVLRVSQEAEINRNSFYYHYSNINDLAQKAFVNNADNEVSRTLVTALLSAFQEGKSAPIFDMSILPHSKRIMLCAASESPYLRQLVTELLKTIWFNSMSIDEELLSSDERVQIRFVFAGLVSVLGSKEIRDNPLSMSVLSQTELGKAIISTMQMIAARQEV
ncbi:TetR/AcrR family transcriptional regulator [Streptococcus sp. H31]|uniref:TetR/AcrR family transcriptional regulator n=1 Tax=Streptococcus huangxiaojuni TaxID=3237239 RepID=UPI0034A48A56